MLIFLKASEIPDGLGLNFALSTDSRPEITFSVDKFELLNGLTLKCPADATKVTIKPLEVGVAATEIVINTSGSGANFSAASFSLTGYRPVNNEGEPLPFREEIFPNYKMEEIEEAIVGDSILLDFLNFSVSFEVVLSEYSPNEGAYYKIAYYDKSQFENDELAIQDPYFIFKKYDDINTSSELDIYVHATDVSYSVRKKAETNEFWLYENLLQDEVAFALT